MRALVLVLVLGCGKPPVDHTTYPLRPTFPSAAGGPVFILGAVKRPGNVPYHRGLTMVQAITAVGGFSPLASSRVRLDRNERGTRRSYTVRMRWITSGRAADPELAPGDIVVVLEAH